MNDSNVQLAKIINVFKSWVTRDIKKLLAAQGAAATIKTDNIWQMNYYEHIIRNEGALAKIREYIQNNPNAEMLNWDNIDK